MEQSLPIAANLLYQQASIVADAVLAEQRRTGSVPDVPADFQKKFYAFLDRITGHLMEDKDNFFGYFLFQMVKDIRFDMASPTGTCMMRPVRLTCEPSLIFVSPPKITAPTLSCSRFRTRP